MDNNDIKKRNSIKGNKIFFKGKSKKNACIMLKTKKIPINLINKNGINNINLDKNKTIDRNRTFFKANNSTNFCKINIYMDRIKSNCFKFYQSFLDNYSNPINKYIDNKPKFLLNNRRNDKINYFKKSMIEKKNIKKNSTTFISRGKYEIDNIFNNNIKNDFFQKKKNLNKKYDISCLFKKKLKKSKYTKLILQKDNINKKSTLTNDIDKIDDNIFDIESEHKQSINLQNYGLYNVNKPYEHNMKFSIFKDYENEDNEHLDNKNIEKIIIGNIDGYKDIIESDENNKENKNQNKIEKNFLLNSNKKKEKIQDNKNNKIIKNIEKSNIWDENSSEFCDINLENNYFTFNIENEYDFEDLPTKENESKINKEINIKNI